MGDDAEAIGHWRKAHLINLRCVEWDARTGVVAGDVAGSIGEERRGGSATGGEREGLHAGKCGGAGYAGGGKAEDGQFARGGNRQGMRWPAQAQGNQKLAAQLRVRQALYEKGEAFRDVKTAAAVSEASATAHGQRNSE